MKQHQGNIFDANEQLQLIDQNRLKQIVTPENLIKKGFTISELTRVSGINATTESS